MIRRRKCFACDSVIDFRITNLGGVRATCPNGHAGAYSFREAKFEQLAEIGISALRDRYFREAVASWNASLERFFEFYWFSSGVNLQISIAHLSDAWKKVASQSERQLGMYIAAYFRDHRDTPVVLPQSQIELRNHVVHRGMIPTESETLCFINSILDVNYKVARSLAMSPGCMVAIERDLESHATFARTGDTNVNFGGGGVYTMCTSAPPDHDIEYYLKSCE